ncbi:TatD family hydrolase [Bacteroidales bacterium]
MQWIDTHTHLYLEQFDRDRDAMLGRAFDAGIVKLLLPNIDQDSVDALLALCDCYPDKCLPMMGLHPTSVKGDAELQLKVVEHQLSCRKYCAIGEIGIDLYWDRTFFDAQLRAFRLQLEWAKEMDLPVAIHTREAFPLILQLVEDAQDGRLKGVFHCFSGNDNDARRIMDMGFLLGIGGVITYKKSILPEVIKQIPTDYLLLETDSPFLPPTPHRGKRNESSFLIETARCLADIKEISMEELAQKTTQNAMNLFKIKEI